MGIGAAVGGIASGVGGILGSNAAASAGQAQAQAAEMGTMAQLGMFQQTQAETLPYRNVGSGAIGQLGSLYGISSADGSSTALTPAQQQANMTAFTQTPDYQFAMQQGTQAVDRSAAASGQLGSGGVIKAATEFGQGLASQQYGNYYNRLLSLAQIGQSATAGQAANNLATGQGVASSLGNAGTAQASGIVGSANALTGSLNSLGTYGALAGMSSYGSGNGSSALSSLGSLFGGSSGNNSSAMTLFGNGSS